MSTQPSKTELGRMGEQIAMQFLQQNGYTVLERNVHCGHQEIDLIVADEHALVFVEVKTRSCISTQPGRYGRPARAVDRTKQHNLLLAAQAYLRNHPKNGLCPRLDVVEVYVQSGWTGDVPPTVLKIHHIRNAFGRS